MQHMRLRVSYYETSWTDSYLAFVVLSDSLQMTSRTRLKRKEVDDVLGGDETWAHADKTQGP